MSKELSILDLGDGFSAVAIKREDLEKVVKLLEDNDIVYYSDSLGPYSLAVANEVGWYINNKVSEDISEETAYNIADNVFDDDSINEELCCSIEHYLY